MRERDRRASGLAVTAAVFGTIASLVVAGVIAAFLILHVTGSPEETATTFLTDWQTQLYADMDAVTLNAPEGGVAGPLRATGAQLGMRHINLVLGHVTQDGSTAQAHFAASVTIATGQVWKYQGQLQLAAQSRKWWVSWSPSDIFPGLQAGQRFVLAAAWGPRAPVLAADGTVLSSPQTVAKSPSLQLVTGNVVRATAAEAKKLGVPYQAGDPIGQGGVQEAYQQQLAGRPAVTVRIEGPGGNRAVAHLPGGPGTQVRTSINMHDQLAASAAVRAATTTRPVDVVALQPSTGRVLAVIERPGGFDRALQGVFPPGSTFKVVTASALSGTGLRPASTVQCPAQVNIGGRVFHNFDNEHLGAISLQTAFAVSC
ncbi:MAG: NTF2-like N-terminal transpeptidase domain-containing protein, partial [Streptosporangiales bacterium]